MGLKIDLYANDGSPIGVIPSDIYGRGVGGAELALMSWAETMATRGHQVRIYNSPKVQGEHGGVIYLDQASFAPKENRDVFVVYRSPNQWTQRANAGMKVHWSTDQNTVGNYARDIFPHVDRVVCISPFHVAFFRQYYGLNEKLGHIDLGVRLGDYAGKKVEKIRGRCIFCSVPDRGLEIMRVAWPRIREARPDATLVITSDYRLWGAPGPGNYQYRLNFLHMPGVTFLGAIPRDQLVQEQLAAQVLSYPCVYEELFCISAAECLVAGALPVTSVAGALPTTNSLGVALGGNPLSTTWQSEFVNTVLAAMDVGKKARDEFAGKAKKRFDWDVICNDWETLFETGEFPNYSERQTP